MKKATAILTVVLVASIAPACHKPPPSAAGVALPTPAPAHSTETTFQADLDGDAKPDSIILQHSQVPDEPGKYRHFIVKFANGKVVETSGSWDEARIDDFPWSENLVPTRSIYAARFVGAGTLLFLFGDDVSCCFQSMEIFQINGDALVPYYSQKEFLFTKELRPQSGGVASLTGLPTRTEGTESSAPDAVKSLSYVPTVVVRLAASAEVDIEASAEATRQRLGGFAGINYREDLLAVTTKTGEKFLWNEKEKKRLQ
jgi:hypothetical protein